MSLVANVTKEEKKEKNSTTGTSDKKEVDLLLRSAKSLLDALALNSTVNSSNLNQTVNLTVSALDNITNVTNVSTNTTTNTSQNTTVNTTMNTTVNISVNTTINTTTNVTNSTTVNTTGNISSNQTNTTTNSSNTTNSTAASIVITTNLTGARPYTMAETQTALFTVQFNQSSTINWYIDDVLVRTADDSSDTFSWTPGMLYTSNSKISTVRVSGTGTAVLNVTVLNDINPFWENDAAHTAAASAELAVITNNNVRQYSSVVVTLSDPTHAYNVTVPLVSRSTAESQWKLNLSNLAEGNTYISRVIVRSNVSNYTADVDVDGDLAHYRQVSTPPSTSGGRGGGGGGGFKNERPRVQKVAEKINASNTLPELVVVTLDKDVVAANDTVLLTLDAKDNEEVALVIATISDEYGNSTNVTLKLINGAKGYGTWSAPISSFGVGKHMVAFIHLTDNINKTASIAVAERAFYVAGKEVMQGEKLLLVYAHLDKNLIAPGDDVVVRMDARDYHGIQSATASFRSKDEERNVTLQLISGGAQYGTWGANVTLNMSDATYTLHSILLDNGVETREVKVYGQKVYVNYVAPQQQLTGMVTAEGTSITDALRNPFTPLLVGLAGMVIAMIIVSSMTFMRREE